MQLMIALHDAAELFREFGYAQFLTHEGVRWRQISRVGGAVVPGAMVGVVFSLNDAEQSEVCLSVGLSWRDDQFVVQGDGTVDDPLPEPGAAGNQRFLVDLPDIQTQNLDECLAALHSHTTRLCAYTSVLDELGIPRTRPASNC
jgi:hypothetical protein